MLEHALGTLQLPRIVAIATPDNRASLALLEGLGMRPAGEVRLPGGDEDLRLYEILATGRPP